jgi:hypothetical protein
VSVNNETEYRDTLSDRGTELGDQLTTGMAPVYAYGSSVVPVALMPEANGLYTDPLNLIFGIQRQVSMEFDKDISARVYHRSDLPRGDPDRRDRRSDGLREHRDRLSSMCN